MADDYEAETTTSREEAATVLHGIADGVAAGAIRLGAGDDERTVDVPGSVDLEVEFERDDGELSLEVELEWPADAVARDSAGTGDTATGEGRPDDATADSLEEAEGVPTEEPGPPEADHPPTEGDVGEGGGTAAGESTDDADEPAVEGVPVGIAEPAAGATASQVSLGRFELFEDRGGEWRWRLVHRNGNVIATSGEGYSRKHNARKGLRSVMRNAQGAEVTERPDE